MIKRILAAAEEIAAVGKLRQHDQVGATLCCFSRQYQALMQVVASVGYTDLWIELNDGDAGRAGWFAHGGDLLLLCNQGWLDVYKRR